MTGGSLMIHDASWCTILIRSSFGFKLLTVITKLSLKISSQCDVNDSLAKWGINKTSLCIFCIKFLSSFHWLHSQMNACILILAMPFFFHHPHQTPSLCPFRPDIVTRQIQVRQSRVLFEAFGQGLTGEMDLESSYWINQTLGLLIPPFLLENFSGYWTKGWGIRQDL